MEENLIGLISGHAIAHLQEVGGRKKIEKLSEMFPSHQVLHVPPAHNYRGEGLAMLVTQSLKICKWEVFNHPGMTAILLKVVYREATWIIANVYLRHQGVHKAQGRDGSEVLQDFACNLQDFKGDCMRVVVLGDWNGAAFTENC